MKTNDIKRGDTVITCDGTRITVDDNKRGVIRRQIVPSLFGPGTDAGDAYIADWKYGPDGAPIAFTVAQKKQLARIRSAGF